jgi:hypothetical protein
MYLLLPLNETSAPVTLLGRVTGDAAGRNAPAVTADVFARLCVHHVKTLYEGLSRRLPGVIRQERVVAREAQHLL